MAKRRMLSQELIYDEEFNSLTLEAQNLFIRMLTVSDDFGVIPATPYTLITLTNPPKKMIKSIEIHLQQIINVGLGKLFTYEEKRYFIFKQSSFDRINSYVINKRTRSEYLKLDKDFIESEKFSELLGNSQQVGDKSIESNKYKVKSIKQKDDTCFKKFWEVYPKKTAKGKAEESFYKINPNEELLNKMIIAVNKQKLSVDWQKENGQYIPMPSTWLNQKRWEDDLNVGICSRQGSGINGGNV